MQAEDSRTTNYMIARMFDFVDLNPCPIKHIYYSTNTCMLYIARNSYSQVYSVVPAQTAKQSTIQQIMVLQPCQYMFEIDGYIVMVMKFQVKLSKNGRWYRYPFTTQLLPSAPRYKQMNNKLYTFHVGQCRQWTISQEDGVNIKYLPKYQIPYHINQQGILQGYGKKIKPDNYSKCKYTTVCQSQVSGYLFVGSDQGDLHIYQTKYLTHVKKFHRHEGPILTIKSKNNVCYFTGSDSKISSIVYIENDQKGGHWMLSKQVRGQSHDIFSIQHMQIEENTSYLLSGGITTDVCFYELSNNILTSNFIHKVSYSHQKLTQYCEPYLLVNKHNSFQIWKIDSKQKQNVELMVKYQMAFYKNILAILVKKQQQNLMIFICTQDEAILWSFQETNGLTKLLTVKNQYNLVRWYKKNCILTIRQGCKLEILNFKTGNIRQIVDLKIQFPTDLSICQKTNRFLVGSKYTNQIQGYEFVSPKKTKRTHKFTLQQSYNVLDFCYYNPTNLMIKLISSNELIEVDSRGKAVLTIISLPIKIVREFGWMPYKSNTKSKLYWYLIGQSKIVVISKMRTNNNNKRLRIKQMPRIANAVINDTQKQNKRTWDFGIVPLNFSKMIEQQIMPIMTKKIL